MVYDVLKVTVHRQQVYLHELCDKKHAAGLQAGSIELHNIAVV